MKDYCSHCRKRTEHIKDRDEMMCLKCGMKSKRFNPTNVLIHGMIGHPKHGTSSHESRESWREELGEHLL